jgi:hypothetical protein
LNGRPLFDMPGWANVDRGASNGRVGAVRKLANDGVDRAWKRRCSGQFLAFPAPGTGLGVGPDLGCAGVGDFLRSVRAAGHRREPMPRGQPDHRREIAASHQWLSANLSCPNPVALIEVLAKQPPAKSIRE